MSRCDASTTKERHDAYWAGSHTSTAAALAGRRGGRGRRRRGRRNVPRHAGGGRDAGGRRHLAPPGRTGTRQLGQGPGQRAAFRLREGDRGPDIHRSHVPRELRRYPGGRHVPGRIPFRLAEHNVFGGGPAALAALANGGTGGGGGGAGNPYRPEQVCGAGYRVVDQQRLTANGAAHGTVYLLYNSGDGRNCAVTLKAVRLGASSPVSAYVEARGRPRTADAGRFAYYA